MGSAQFFTPYRGFLLITLLVGMLYCLFFQGLKDLDSLTCEANFLFSGIYLSPLFNFKIGPSLDLSFLMSSMFIIILIIRIIKTTCFDNTILMAELEGKLPQRRWSLSVHNFPNSGYFHKIFGTLRKGQSTSTLKIFYRSCYIFGFITHLLMDK